MPFGLASAPVVLTNLKNRVFYPRLDSFVVLAIDDVLVYSKSKEEHFLHLKLGFFSKVAGETTFGSCANVNFGFKKWNPWEHVLPKEGIRMNPKKVEVVVSWERPTIIAEIRSFLGLASYYRCVIPRFSSIALPMTKLIRKNVRFVWSDECEASF